MFKSLLMTAVFCTLVGCNNNSSKNSEKTKPSPELKTQLVANNNSEKQHKGEEVMPLIKIRGTVKYLNLEGGFYAIYADDGAKYTPFNLAKEYRIAGLVVEIEGRLMDDMLSIQQHGEMLKIESVKIIDASQAEDR